MLKQKKRIIILLILRIGLSVGCIYMIFSRSYPVAFVGWREISSDKLKTDSAIGMYYYKKAIETYIQDKVEIMDSTEAKTTVQQAALNRLVENIFVHQELLRRLKEKEIQEMVDKKISDVLNKPNITQEVKTLYGISLEDFKNRLLVPTAEGEILESRLLLEGKSFNDWIREARSKNSVIILLPGFVWDREQGVVTK